MSITRFIAVKLDMVYSPTAPRAEALFWAAALGQVGRLRQLLDAGEQATQAALYTAATNGNRDTVVLLLERGAVAGPDWPMQAILAAGHFECATLLHVSARAAGAQSVAVPA